MLSVPAKDGPDGQISLHASTIVIDQRALVLAGPSGVGKSTLALRMISLGAQLLADDVTWLAAVDTGVEARCPPALEGQIEARGVGILNAPHCDPAMVSAIVDLGRAEDDRLPPFRSVPMLGYNIPILHKPATCYLPEILIHYLKYGRHA